MKLIIVIPCYNEEEVLQETTKQLSVVIDRLIKNKKVKECSILYVDDGSKDSTWQIIETLGSSNKYVHGLKLAHNVGHQNALWAGLEWTVNKCDAVVSIDADLQHDINTIEVMVDEFNEGYEVVLGIRNDRQTDSWFKKNTALFFYKLMQKMGVDVVRNHADFRLLSQRAIQSLMQYSERNIFIRGMVRLIGLKTTEVYFNCNDRFAGESKYTLSKMLNFALDGITSFSVQPLRWITSIGVISLIIAICEIVYAIIAYCNNATIPGWTSLLISMWLIGGLLFLSIGVIGEYIGKIYKEVKRRPRFLVEKVI